MASDECTPPVRTDIRKSQKWILRKNIKEILVHFKYNQLISDILLNLFELEPDALYQKLQELKLPNNKEYVANLLNSRTQSFSIEELEEIYHALQLYRIVFFNKHKKWIPINLLEPADDLEYSEDEKVIRRNILQALRIKGLNAVVKVIIYEELIWVMIIEKKLTKRRGLKLLKPIFICYEVGMPYFFTAAKISNIIMECILRAMQYKKYKVQQLEGRDVKSLITILKHKSMNNSNTIIPYRPAQATIGHRFVDVSNNKSRESYVNRVFDSKDPISLETFSVTATSVWGKNNLVPDIEGEPIKVTMTLKSRDLVKMIKEMVNNDMVPTPLPEYLQTIMRSGKNKVCMIAQRNNTKA